MKLNVRWWIIIGNSIALLLILATILGLGFIEKDGIKYGGQLLNIWSKPTRHGLMRIAPEYVLLVTCWAFGGLFSLIAMIMSWSIVRKKEEKRFVYEIIITVFSCLAFVFTIFGTAFFNGCVNASDFDERDIEIFKPASLVFNYIFLLLAGGVSIPLGVLSILKHKKIRKEKGSVKNEKEN